MVTLKGTMLDFPLVWNECQLACHELKRRIQISIHVMSGKPVIYRAHFIDGILQSTSRLMMADSVWDATKERNIVELDKGS